MRQDRGEARYKFQDSIQTLTRLLYNTTKQQHSIAFMFLKIMCNPSCASETSDLLIHLHNLGKRIL